MKNILKEKVMLEVAAPTLPTRSSAAAQKWWALSQVTLLARVVETVKTLPGPKSTLFFGGASS
jgi:hypothetical protein